MQSDARFNFNGFFHTDLKDGTKCHRKTRNFLVHIDSVFVAICGIRSTSQCKNMFKNTLNVIKTEN